jgi:hypothetical protein
MIKRAADERLKLLPFQIHVLRRINPGVFRFAQRLRTRGAESDDQYLRPFYLDLLDEPLTFPASQVEEENGRLLLSQDGIEPAGIIDGSDLNLVAEIGARAPHEIRILGVKNAGGGEYHAAATSSWKRTSGRRM